VKKGEVARAVIVRTQKELPRPDGSFDPLRRQLGGLINKENEPIGYPHLRAGRSRAARKRFMKIISLAPEVL
jgi:large subunit ribosomal protein L14